MTYTVLPIELGDIAGTRTRIELVAVPGSPEQAPTRKQLLDGVDGIVLVVDAQADRVDENAAIVDELRKSLHDYARPLDDLPLVVQYNKRDLSDAYVIDELHRRMGLGGATVFETVASDANAVLQTLSTISKKVIRALREESIAPHQGVPPFRVARPEPALAEPVAPPEPVVEPDPVAGDDEPEDAGLLAEPEAADDLPAEPEPISAPIDEELEFGSDADGLSAGEVSIGETDDDLATLEPDDAYEVSGPQQQLEEAILAEAEGEDEAADVESAAARSLIDQPWHEHGDALEPPLGARIENDLTIVSVGQATRADERSVRVPIVLGDGDGETSTLVLTLRLDPLVDESEG